MVVGEGGKGLSGAEVGVEDKELGVLTRNQEQAAIARIKVG